MKRAWIRFETIIILALVFSAFSGVLYGNNFAVEQKQYTNFPLYFVENQGQLDQQVSYYVPGQENTLYFTKHGLTFVLHPKNNSNDHGLNRVTYSPSSLRTDANRWVIKLDFVGANNDSKPEGQNLTPAIFNYFRGAKRDWKTAVKTYSSLKYSNLWPGIDLIYSGTSNQVKYNFIIKPGVDPNQIQLTYKGASNVAVRENGELEISTPVASFRDDAPVAYQEIDGKHRKVSVNYSIHEGTENGTFSYGFHIGAYDKNEPLVLDPAIFMYAGFLGGSGDDYALGVAVDQQTNAYVVGSTDSVNFPVQVGPYLSYQGGPFDGFIAKIAYDSSLVFVGYLGGPDEDGITDVAVDANGNAYVTGVTNSVSGFPIIGGPGLSYNGGSLDSFVAKIDSSGTFLHYSGYLGGKETDHAVGIALDQYTNAYVTGQTNSDENTFPVVVGPDLTYNGGAFDAFVAKVDASGSVLKYCGYIGGAGEDTSGDIAVLKESAYISGTTDSNETSFPVLVGPDLTFNGIADAFVARVHLTGSSLLLAGYIGGSAHDQAGSKLYAGGVAVDRRGNIYVAGGTFSDETTFPVLNGPDLTYNGFSDAFIAKFKSNGTALYCGYIGGDYIDDGRDVEVDTSGNAYIAGVTASTQTTFPLVDGPDSTFGGGFMDAFVARVNIYGLALDYCGYIGGDQYELSFSIAVDQERVAYVTGWTASDETSFPVVNGPIKTFSGGNNDAFITKIRWP